MPLRCWIFVLVAAAGGIALAQDKPRRAVISVRGDDPLRVLEAAANWAAHDSAGAFLIDSPAAREANRRFCVAYAADSLLDDRDLLHRPRSERAVVCRSADPRLRLASAALAVAANARLHLDGALPEPWPAEIDLVGADDSVFDGRRVRRLVDHAAVMNAAHQLRGSIETIVLTNPAEWNLACLAPLALRGRRAALLMTNAAGTDAGAIIRRALAQPEFALVENVVILGSPSGIPPERRPNPLAGKDDEIEMEPGTPAPADPHTLAIGRLFHRDPAFVALTLARNQLLPAPGTARTALVASNPGETLPMLEAFSRTSARELSACGYHTVGLFGDSVTPAALRKRLPDADVFLWEGHHNTLVKNWGFSTWSDPLPPSFIFLQSCLALTDETASPLFERGALAVVGSSTRIYSATGGAFSLACLDAMLYEQQSLGGAVRSAKNFLLAYGQLKQKRIDDARFGGANQRSEWAFTLWGDPALRLPAPSAPTADSVRVRTAGDTITLHVPQIAPEPATSGPFRAPYRPNGRLAGLVRSGDDGEKRLVPLAFVEVQLPHAPHGAKPELRSKLNGANWVFLWDARRRSGWLLVAPPAAAERDIRFQVEWKAHDG